MFLEVGGRMYQINNKTWYIRLVRSDSPMLMRSDGSITVGMCDRETQKPLKNLKK